MATLTISHYIYLTKEQRYALHEGQNIEVIGVSVPVWFQKGSTSEPAKELFCKYELTNEKVNKVISKIEEGYAINIPQKIETTNEMQISLSQSDRLLDRVDKGDEFLDFKQYNKALYNHREFDVVHFVEIKKLETLVETLS